MEGRPYFSKYGPIPDPLSLLSIQSSFKAFSQFVSRKASLTWMFVLLSSNASLWPIVVELFATRYWLVHPWRWLPVICVAWVIVQVTLTVAKVLGALHPWNWLSV